MLRSSRRTPRPHAGSQGPGAAPDGWLTVKEASEATGVPTSTIRKWARHENIPSYLEATENGYLRIVSMRGIEAWAEEIGRDVGGDEEPISPETGTEVDLTESEAKSGDDTVPEGTMLVPLDAWNKMLNQLGNLHEAGQQLAEARERAAKAETEAQFLRERLRELRAEAEGPAQREETGSMTGDAAPEADESSRSARSLVRKVYNDWRRNRRR